jgi:TetR/AcrR family transcriptional repressor of mexJK operon
LALVAGLITDTGDPRADLQAAAARLVRGITAPDVAALHRLTIALAVPDPATSARQFVMLLSAEAQVRSLRGLQPLSKREVTDIARDTADLIVRAHQPQPR